LHRTFNGFTHEFLGLSREFQRLAATTLYFSADLQGETHGLRGPLTPVTAEEDGSIA